MSCGSGNRISCQLRCVHLKEPSVWGATWSFRNMSACSRVTWLGVGRQVGQWVGQGARENSYVILRILEIITSDRKYWKESKFDWIATNP